MLAKDHIKNQFDHFQQDHKPRLLLPDTILDRNGKESLNFISIPEKVIEKIKSDELKCPICLGSLSETIKVVQCQHRFCKECFERSMRELKMEGHACPKCRERIASRRDSKADPTFDALISVVEKALAETDSPLRAKRTRKSENEDEIGRAAKKSLYKEETNEGFEINKFRELYLRRVEEFKKRQKQIQLNNSSNPGNSSNFHQQFFQNSDKNYFSSSHPSNKFGKTNGKSSSAKMGSVSGGTAGMKDTPTHRVCFALCPFPQWKPDEQVISHVAQQPGAVYAHDLQLTMPYLKAPELMQVGELKQFLQVRLRFPEEIFRRIEILIPLPNSISYPGIAAEVEKWIILDECLTMSDVVMLFWDAKTELILYYRTARRDSIVPEDREENKGMIVNHSPREISAH